MPRQAADDARWRAAVDDFRRSGMTRAEFCRRRGLPPHSFRKHLYGRRGATTAPAPADAPRFVPVSLAAGPEAAADPLVLILDGRRRIAVAAGFDPATLRRLLDALGDRP